MSKFKIGDKVITTKQGDWYESGEVFTLKGRYIGKGSTGWFVEENYDSRFVHEENIELYLKSLLTNGRRVRLRNNEMFTIIDDALVSLYNNWSPVLSHQSATVSQSYNEVGNNFFRKEFDIVQIYERPASVASYFNYDAITVTIWQREVKTAKQSKMEELQKKAQEVADAIKNLQDEE